MRKYIIIPLIVALFLSSTICYAESKPFEYPLPYQEVKQISIKEQYMIWGHYTVKPEDAIKYIHQKGYLSNKKLEELKILDLTEANYKETFKLEKSLKIEEYRYINRKEITPTIVIPEEMIKRYDIIKCDEYLFFNISKDEKEGVFYLRFIPIKGGATLEKIIRADGIRSAKVADKIIQINTRGIKNPEVSKIRNQGKPLGIIGTEFMNVNDGLIYWRSKKDVYDPESKKMSPFIRIIGCSIQIK